MVQITKQDELFALRMKRDKMIEAAEVKGMSKDEIKEIFGLSIENVINEIASVCREIEDDITTYPTEVLKAQKEYQEGMIDQNPVVIFTTNEIIQELKRRAEDVVNNKIRFTEDYGETTPAICAATSF